MIMAAHAKHGPSGIETGWGLCPARIAIPSRGSAAADDGTRKHALLEWWCRKWLAGEEPFWPESIPRGEGDETYKILRGDVDDVRPAAKWFSEHPAAIGARENRMGYFVALEKRVRYGKALGYTDSNDYFGTVDMVLSWPEGLEIVDYKSGFTYVPHERNLQTFLYKLGVISDTSIPYAGGRTYLTIVQPVYGEPRRWELTAAEQKALEKEVRRKIDATLQDPLPRIPGTVQCRYCEEQTTCKGRIQWVADQLTGRTPTVIVPDNHSTTTPQEAVVPENPPDTMLPAKSAVEEIVDEVENLATLDPEAMTKDEASRILALADVVIPLFTAVKTQWVERVISGETLPGWKIIAGKRSQVYAVDEEEVKDRCRKTHLKKAQYVKESVLSPAQLVKVLGAELSERQFKKVKEDLIQWKDGKPQLVPENDPRPAIEPVAFSPVAEPKPQQESQQESQPQQESKTATSSAFSVDDLI